MLSGVRKFSNKIPVNEVGEAPVAEVAGVVGCSFRPAARINQTPPIEKSSNRKYGK